MQRLVILHRAGIRLKIHPNYADITISKEIHCACSIPLEVNKRECGYQMGVARDVGEGHSSS
jgi:hypothetical protein